LSKVLSVNLGTPKEIGNFGRKKVLSAIYKSAVKGEVTVLKLNLEGDKQADLRVHGGEYKAVYGYASENYSYWRKQFPDLDMPWGTFGENLTTEGLLEDSIHPGDQLKIGSAELEITQPRFPCYKLGMKFGTDRMVDLFTHSQRPGFYMRVVKEGKLKAGDEIRLTRVDENSAGTIASIYRATILEEEGKAK